MEFGTAIPLFYLTLCCVLATPIVGLFGTIFIRFSLEDIQLARNIILTVLAVCLLWFLFPFIQVLVAAFMICRTCPDDVFRLTSEMLAATLRFATGLLIPGLATGVLLAFIVVLPVTLLVRRFRGSRLGSEKSL